MEWIVSIPFLYNYYTISKSWKLKYTFIYDMILIDGKGGDYV